MSTTLLWTTEVMQPASWWRSSLPSRSTLRDMVGVLGVLWMTVVIGGCATLGARLEGVSGSIAWQATDLRVVERQVTETSRELYAFTLVLKETQGRGVTFTHLEYTMSQPDIVPIGDTQRATIAWRLHPYGELRHPFYSSIYCSEMPCQNWGPRLRGGISSSLALMSSTNPSVLLSISDCPKTLQGQG
jgi:hypothetical protein